MKKYIIEKTLTTKNRSHMYPQGYKASYICKGDHFVWAKAFFDRPALWSEYLYTSKKRAERSVKTMQEKHPEKYWDVSFRIVEIEAS